MFSSSNPVLKASMPLFLPKAAFTAIPDESFPKDTYAEIFKKYVKDAFTPNILRPHLDVPLFVNYKDTGTVVSFVDQEIKTDVLGNNEIREYHIGNMIASSCSNAGASRLSVKLKGPGHVYHT